MLFSDASIQSYLYFGASYGTLSLGAKRFLADAAPTAADRRWAANASRAQLVDEGVRRLRQATVQSLEASSPGPHAVQLSGGYDSRAILGALREHLDASELMALTFGTPGSPDYEIPRTLATHVGISHERLDATAIQWDADDVVRYARTALTKHPAALVLERYVNYRLRMVAGTDPTFWVGLLGDALAGAHLPSQPSTNWEAAITRFLSRNRRVKSTSLTQSGWSPRSVFPEHSLADASVVGFDDQLDLAGRQAFYIDIPWRPFRDQHLFDSPAWKRFMLALPWHERANGMALYLDIMARAFPVLSAFPVQGGRRSPARPSLPRRAAARASRMGRRVAQRLTPGLVDSPPDVMRMDYTRSLIGSGSHTQITHTLLDSLGRRGLVPHVDVEQLWDEHQHRTSDHAAALMTLAGLEVNIQAAEECVRKTTA